MDEEKQKMRELYERRIQLVEQLAKVDEQIRQGLQQAILNNKKRGKKE